MVCSSRRSSGPNCSASRTVRRTCSFQCGLAIIWLYGATLMPAAPRIMARRLVVLMRSVRCSKSGIPAHHPANTWIGEFGALAFFAVPAWIAQLCFPLAFGSMSLRFLSQAWHRLRDPSAKDLP